MSLTLVGTGVSFDLTLGGIEALRNCDEVYIETYTNPADLHLIESVEKLVEKKFRFLEREKVESRFLIEQAKTKRVCLLCSGDPLIATTHIILAIDAKQYNIGWRVIHNSSIYSVAPACSGLQIYRFGKTATLVNPRPNYKPVSSLEIIRENQSRNLHTLVLLDTEPTPMDAKTALELLKEFDSAIILSRLGQVDEMVSFGKISTLLASPNPKFAKPPITIIIPAKLHPVEEEYLETTNAAIKQYL